MLENNPAGLNGAEIERVVGNQYNRLSQAATGIEGIVGIEGHRYDESREVKEQEIAP